MRANVSAILAATALLCAGGADAGLPLLTEDGGVLGGLQCEAEAATFSTRVSAASGLERSLSLSCGVGYASQLGVGISRANQDGERANGLSFSGKTGLWAGQSGGSMAVAWGARWSRVTGGGWRDSGIVLNAVYSGPASVGLMLHGNLGHERDPMERSVATIWALALEHAAFALGGLQIAPMAEVFGDDHSAPFWSAALRFTLLPDRFYLGLSYGRQINHARARLATASIKFAF